MPKPLPHHWHKLTRSQIVECARRRSNHSDNYNTSILELLKKHDQYLKTKIPTKDQDERQQRLTRRRWKVNQKNRRRINKSAKWHCGRRTTIKKT